MSLKIDNFVRFKLLRFLSTDPEAQGKSVRISFQPDAEPKAQFRLSYDDKKDSDRVFSLAEGKSVVIDKRIADRLLNGATLSWKKNGIYGSGFSIQKDFNPQCDCGKIINTKEISC